MYLTDFRENSLEDVIRNLEPDLFKTVTGLTVADFNLLVDLKVFNTERMNGAFFAFHRYEDSSHQLKTLNVWVFGLLGKGERSFDCYA